VTDEGQTGLGDFDRPDEEAAAIAGPDTAGGADVVDPERESLPPAEGEVELAVTQVDYTVVGGGREERPVVHVFGRRPVEDGTDPALEHVRVRGFRPYFYAPTASLSAADLEDDRITGHEAGYESIRGDDLTRIYGRTPRDVGAIRDEFDHYEADILFPNRLLIDKGIRGGVRVPERRDEDGSLVVDHEELRPADVAAPPRVCTLDIEVDDRQGFPEDGEETIVCLTTHDSYDDEYVAWLYDAGETDPPETLAGYEQIDEGGDVRVEVFDSEPAMLAALVAYVEDRDPDLLTGWNFEDFDMPYLLDRMELLDDRAEVEADLDVDRLSRVDEVWRSGWGGPDVKGRVVFDLLYAYKRTQFTELESYRLDAVGETELDVGKERYPGDIGDLWEDDPERLLEYNLRDVELCVEIDRKQSIVSFWVEVASFVGCKIEDAPTPGDAVDQYVLQKVHGDYVLPSKGKQDSEDYEGGAVFDPITGVREMVSVLDLKSLYPMAMVTINASPETKAPDSYDGETYHAPNGQEFVEEPDGIIREMVDELLSEREQKKARRNEHDPGSEAYGQYDRQQQAVKVIMNSLYGVLGWDRFRLYDKEMGAAVTATGRAVIEYTEEVVDDLGYRVVYGDTDSVMLELGGDVSTGEAIDVSQDLEGRINDSYDEFARERLGADAHRFQIEFEKLYRRFFQAGKKKRYAGHIVWKEGKDVDDVDITGFEYKRSDIAPVTKEVQREVIERIVTGEDVDSVTDYVADVIDRFERGEYDLDDVGIPGGIGKRLDAYDTDTAQVRGAKYANLLLGTNFGRGSKPKRLYLEPNGVHPEYFRRLERDRPEVADAELLTAFKRDVSAGDGVICFEYADQVPEEFDVDWEKMLEKTLRGPIARVLEALDVSWEEVRSGQEQTGLGQFMD
jgi:DNA polymerase I